MEEKPITANQQPTIEDQGTEISDSLQDTPQSLPEVTYHFAELPLTRLHYIKCGSGFPVIMVPATISELDNWIPLAQFMGQRYTAYFFELPGHGHSSPFPQAYASELVAQTMEDFIDVLGYDRINLMGFSFGGVLTMKILCHLQDRVENLFLLSPAMTKRALPFSKTKLRLLQGFSQLICTPAFIQSFVKIIQGRITGPPLLALITKFGKIEANIGLREKMKRVPPFTIDVLAHQIREVLYLEHVVPKKLFQQPCYFAMSIYDPFLSYTTTLDVINKLFKQVHVQELYLPYHQAPGRVNFERLNLDYGHLLDLLPY